MKFFAFLVLVLVGVWFFRNRQAQMNEEANPPQPAQPQAMLRCDRCGVHLPGSEAVKGIHGNYCCQDHLHQSEP